MQHPYRFKCVSCDQWHEGIPGWGWKRPVEYFTVPEPERDERCFITTDLCVVDDKAFFVCGCYEAPVVGSSDIISLRLWARLSENDFMEFQSLIGVSERSHFGPYRGTLDISIPTYPETYELPVTLQIRNDGTRPLVRVADSSHPLAKEQESGATMERVQALYNFFEHGVEG